MNSTMKFVVRMIQQRHFPMIEEHSHFFLYIYSLFGFYFEKFSQSMCVLFTFALATLKCVQCTSNYGWTKNKWYSIELCKNINHSHMIHSIVDDKQQNSVSHKPYSIYCIDDFVAIKSDANEEDVQITDYDVLNESLVVLFFFSSLRLSFSRFIIFILIRWIKILSAIRSVLFFVQCTVSK